MFMGSQLKLIFIRYRLNKTIKKGLERIEEATLPM